MNDVTDMTKTAPFIHPQALCESEMVGPGTRIWAFAHVLPGAQIGADCNICDGVFIEGTVVVGDRVTVKCGVQLWDGVRLEDDVYVGPNATFTNDRFPRSKAYPARYAETIVRRGASIGANATILPGLEIGERAMVGAGSVVTGSVPANAIVMGSPARVTGYMDADGGEMSRAPMDVLPPDAPLAPVALGVGAASMQGLRRAGEMGVSIGFGDLGSDVPFVPRHCTLEFGQGGKALRAGHAMRSCHQMLVCTSGAVSMLLDDGSTRREIRLDRCDVSVYVPPMVWQSRYRHTDDAVVLVFASECCGEEGIIRSYQAFQHALSVG